MAPMKKLFLLVCLLIVSASVFVGCDSGGDQTSPPATNAPAKPAK